MAKSIMIQGTMSNAGKSLLAAALCRIFREDGYKTAPFKSQNMALNSYVTSDGLEMGRAQVMQAEAAGIQPSVYMNPILLKPTGEMGSQVIVMGEVQGDMNASDYFRYRQKLIPRIMEAYHALEEEYELIVLEGAGSPAEINLNENDLVNMGMARMAGAPVLLAGDIDRGGFFAQIYGTWALLRDEDRRYMKGWIVNKFRGNVSLLLPGIREMEDKTGLPCAGIVPMLNIDLDDEDSLSPRLLNHDKPDACSIDIAVVRLRWLSNFTDMNELEHQPGVRIRYVEDPDFDGSPDALILPGTKNTMADLAWLRESGMEDRILEEKRRGTLIFGICGGYQLLGKSLEDLTAGERGKKVKGLGLLPVETTFSERKIRRRTEAVVHPQTGIFGKLSGRKITGYEIHMGETVIFGKPFLSARDAVSGDIYDDGCAEDNVCGTYVHGFFDETEVSQAFLEILATRRGISWRSEGKESRIAYKEAQYDRLADSVRKALNMDLIYRIIEQGISD